MPASSLIIFSFDIPRPQKCSSLYTVGDIQLAHLFSLQVTIAVSQNMPEAQYYELQLRNTN